MKPRTLATIFWLLGMTVSAHAQVDQWVPYTIQPHQCTELRVWTSGDMTHARVVLTLPDLGYRITDWGQVERQGNGLSVDIKAEDWTGGSGQMIQVLEQFYDLGPLPSQPGAYSFTVRSRGAQVCRVDFDPTQIVEHWEEASLPQSGVLFVVNTTGGLTTARPCLRFADTGYRVVEWRDPVRSGNDFSTTVKLERFTGRVERPRVLAEAEACRLFVLGVNLPPNETFTFTIRFTDGVAHTSRPFTPVSQSGGNPIEHPAFFVRQHYLDFLGREPDTEGLNFWYNELTGCLPFTTECVERRRESVSAAFFLSVEFQQTGFLVHRLYKAAFNRIPRFAEFLPDTRRIGEGLVVNQEGWQERLEANTRQFVEEFVARAEFRERYPEAMTPEQYVDALNLNVRHDFPELDPGPLTPAERAQLVDGLRSGAETRATVLRKVAEHPAMYQLEYRRAFVLSEYFGYLRRNPNDPPDNNWEGFFFWLQKLNSHGGDFHAAEMVRSFLVSGEYRNRFVQN